MRRYAYGPISLHYRMLRNIEPYFQYVIGERTVLLEFLGNHDGVIALARDEQAARLIVDALNRPLSPQGVR